MDDRRLRYFLAVVDEGSVTRAAHRLRVAQPSLSQSLRALESELGVQLFHRVGRGLRLSTAGEALIGPARQIERTMREVRNVISGVLELQTGTFQVAALATLAVDPMARLIGRFRAAHPGVEVQVFEPETADEVSALVRDGACELGAAHLPLGRGQLITEPIGAQELQFVLPPEARADERPLRPRELADMPFVVSPPGTSTRLLLEHALAAVGVTPRIAVQTASREAIIPLVLAGAGATLLPAPLATEARRRGATVRSARPPITRTVGLVYRQGSLSPAGAAFLALAANDRDLLPESSNQQARARG